jgi:predicted transcriptional regulator
VDYNKLIEESGLRKNFIAKKMGISPTLLSLFIHNKKTLAPHRKRMLDQI